MSATATDSWVEANQRYLSAALAEVYALLAPEAATGDTGLAAPPAVPAAVPVDAEDIDPPPALERLCALFGLSAFERTVLLLCAGMELDSRFAAACAAAHGDPRRPFPSFGLALAALPGAHWSALTPHAPLRYWRLVDLSGGDELTGSRLRIDERILHFLTAVPARDERLTGLVDPVTAGVSLAPSQLALAERLAGLWAAAAPGTPLPVVQLCGADPAGLRAVAWTACAFLDLELARLPLAALPTDARELEALGRLWTREAALNPAALLIECGEAEPAEPAREAALARLLETLSCPLIIAGQARRSSPHRPLLTLELPQPTVAEQRELWQAALGPAAATLNGRLDTLLSQFVLSAPAIEAVAAATLSAAGDADAIGAQLWQACRSQARPRLDELAQRIEPAAGWADLVLPAEQLRLLREIAIHVRRRLRVYEDWDFAARGACGLGISALFSGPSGTGKTMAAEVLAGELGLDLYKIDLSQVVSKYIGETEKNLRRVFDAAELGGAILLFDEADALFGKRSEVKDSHDRYANIEISYLLQRMEAYRGLAVLTTNMKSALDQAFLRRLRFVVQFPFPDAAQRAAIWQRIFPAAVPTDGVAIERLARLNLAGGNIRNIALYAAFLAAESGEAVGMRQLLRATQVEYAKIEKPLSATDIRDWITVE